MPSGRSPWGNLTQNLYNNRASKFLALALGKQTFGTLGLKHKASMGLQTPEKSQIAITSFFQDLSPTPPGPLGPPWEGQFQQILDTFRAQGDMYGPACEPHGHGKGGLSLLEGAKSHSFSTMNRNSFAPFRQTLRQTSKGEF